MSVPLQPEVAKVGPRLRVVPIELADANTFVAALHRHHEAAQGHRFSLGVIVEDTGVLVGVAIVGRPVAGNRIANGNRSALEVVRLCTDGTYNACSALYAAAARAGKALGYQWIQTYTLPEEGGASLRASGWECEGEAGGGSWNSASRRREDKHPIGRKLRWVRHLNAAFPEIVLPANVYESDQLCLKWTAEEAS